LILFSVESSIGLSIPRSWWYTALLGLFAAALLPWIAHQIRRFPQNRCALDGAEVDPAVAVHIVSRQDGLSQFCSITCAERWLRASRVLPLEIRVVDESTGIELNTADAFYVRSQIVAHAPTRERRHVFGSLEEAQRHADDHFGRILPQDERPFAEWTGRSRQPDENPSSAH